MFWYCETKQIWRKIVIPAASLIPNLFRYQKFSETQKGSSSKFFGTMRQRFSNGKSWYPLAEITEIIGGIDLCKNALKTKIKTVVLSLTVAKFDQNICSWAKNVPVQADRLVSFFQRQINGWLFFAAYVICKKFNSFNRVVFLFSVQNSRFFLFKNKWQQWGQDNMVLQQKVRGRVSVVPNIFMISLAFVRNSIPVVPIAQWVGQQGSEPVGRGSSLFRAKYLYDFTDICQKFQWFPWHSG